jgi:hypothetical protein
MPYIYSLGYFSHQTGAPFMRGLFMDFSGDPKVASIGDEYMFGAGVADRSGHRAGRDQPECLAASRDRLV